MLDTHLIRDDGLLEGFSRNLSDGPELVLARRSMWSPRPERVLAGRIRAARRERELGEEDLRSYLNDATGTLHGVMRGGEELIVALDFIKGQICEVDELRDSRVRLAPEAGA
jgi:hypothetical protein